MTNQLSMFPGAEDTPLFSGTAQRVKDDTFTPQAVNNQLSMGCAVCHDTGRVVTNTLFKTPTYCTCAAGDKAYQESHKKA